MFGVEPQVDVALVVLEDDVVARPVLLDQVVLENQRFLLGAGDDVIDAHRSRDQELHRGPAVTTLAEVVPHPRSQRLSFSDIDHPPGFVLEKVDARVGREALGLTPESIGSTCDLHTCSSITGHGVNIVRISGARRLIRSFEGLS
jgi:hypothetical protein